MSGWRMRRAAAGTVALAALLILGACSEDEPPPPAHPDLECDGARSITSESDVDESQPGAATAEEALAESVDRFTQIFPGEVVALSSLESAVVVDGRRVFIATAHESRATGDYLVTEIHYCETFSQTAEGETPRTAPPATPDS